MEDVPREELYDDKYYNLILPENDRVKAKLRNRAEYEAKIRQEEMARKQLALIFQMKKI